MQPLRFIQQTNLIPDGETRRPRQHTCRSGHQNRFSQTSFANQGNQVSRFTDYHAKITTRRNSSEWSALEKPVAPPKSSAACRKFALNSCPAFHMLELSKGFQPP